MPPVELAPEPPLRSLLLASQVRCSYQCCGLAAYAFEPSVARAWVRRFGPHAVDDTLAHLDDLIALCAAPARNVSCSTINELTWDNSDRAELLAFFRDLRASLARL